jgi:Protein of unknown function (DUF2845)
MRCAVGLGLLLLATGTARAHDFRCGVHLVKLADTEAEVRDKCGEPTTQIRKQGRGRWGMIVHDLWIYNLGPTQFLRILSFEADRLINISLGDYGR